MAVRRSWTVIDEYPRKADLEPDPTETGLDENAINVDDTSEWLIVAIDTLTNEFRHIRPFQARRTERVIFSVANLAERTLSDTPWISSMRTIIDLYYDDDY